MRKMKGKVEKNDDIRRKWKVNKSKIKLVWNN